MKKRIQGFVTGALAVAMLGCITPMAREAAESITAVYHNIKLVVDGVLVEPKDASGNIVEPFIYNGTTYLPVRAVATAFEKEVVWDQDSYTVFLGGEVDKPAKELPLWNRSYTECSDPSNIKFYEEDGNDYIKMFLGGYEETIGDNRYYCEDYITYPVNTLAKSIKGEFCIRDSRDRHASECILKILGTNGKVLYKSPIMRDSTANVKFDVNIENELEITLLVECAHDDGWYDAGAYAYLKNVNIVSSDY